MLLARTSEHQRHFAKRLNSGKITVNFGSPKVIKGPVLNKTENVVAAFDRNKANFLLNSYGINVPKSIRAQDLFNNDQLDLSRLQVRGFTYPIIAKRNGLCTHRVSILSSIDELMRICLSDNVKEISLEQYIRNCQSYRIYTIPALSGKSVDYTINGHPYQDSLGIPFAVKRNLELAENSNMYKTKSYEVNDALSIESMPISWLLMLRSAVKATRVLGLDFASVDMLYNPYSTEYFVVGVDPDCPFTSSKEINDQIAEALVQGIKLILP